MEGHDRITPWTSSDSADKNTPCVQFQSSIPAVMLGWLMLNEGLNHIQILAAGVVVEA